MHGIFLTISTVGPALALSALLAACSHTSTIRSAPAGADVFVETEEKPRCQTPCEIRDDPKRIRLQKDGLSVEVALERRLDVWMAVGQTSVACVIGASTIACISGGVWLLGTGLSLAAPFIAPVIALCGGPPAALGQLFWTLVMGGICGSIALPFAALDTAQVIADDIQVNLHQGTVVTQPQGLGKIVPNIAQSQPGATTGTDKETRDDAEDNGRVSSQAVQRSAQSQASF